MLKWSIMKPVQGWQEDDTNLQVSPNSPIISQPPNMIQQLINDNNNSTIPCLLKVKSLMFNTNNANNSSFSQPNLTEMQLIDNKNLIESIKNDDIWLILEKYYSSYLMATCLDLNSNSSCKKFAIPFDFDGLFSLVVSNKRSAKVYSTIKDLQGDIKKSYKIILLKSCIGYVIENKNENENINHEILLLNKNFHNKLNNKKQTNQYRIHKIDEGKILRFEKFCYIETTKCDLQPQQSTMSPLSSPRVNTLTLKSKDNDENFFTIKTIDSNKILSGTSTTNTTSSSYGKKSLFTSLFSNFLNSSNNSTVRSTHKADASDSVDLTDDGNVNIYLSQKSAKSFSPTYDGSHSRRLKKSFELNINDNHDSSNKGSPIGRKTSGKIIRVAKCYDMDTDAIIYLRETCTGEFMIDASTPLNTTSPASSQRHLSPAYLYNIRTLVETNFLFDIEHANNNIELELVMKVNTKFNRLPFIRICFNSNEIITVRNQQTIIIYDVNKNKFLEYFLNDLLRLTNFYKFNKSINNDDLLNKYKAKLDWCMQTINEFKFDVKLKLNYLSNSSKLGFYLEQYLFRTYSRRNFQRRTSNTASLPATNLNKELAIHASDDDDDYEDDDSIRNNNNSKRLSIDSNDSDSKKESKFKRIIKFATTNQSKNSALTQKQLSNMTLNEAELKYKRKLSEQVLNSTEKLEQTKTGGNSTNYATVRNKLASIFLHATSNSNASDINSSKNISQSTNTLLSTVNSSPSANGVDNKNYVTVISINGSTNSINSNQQNNVHYNDIDEQHFKQPKKIFKRPTFLNSFTKQTSLTASSALDINEQIAEESHTKPSHHTSHIAISNNQPSQQQQQQQNGRAASVSLMNSKDKEDNHNSSKRSLQNLLNITIRKKTGTNLSSTEDYLESNKNVEVTAI